MIGVLLMSLAMGASEQPVRYLALGDSYTIGESVPVEGRWPVQLAESLGIPEPRIVAKTGWTTDELSAAMDEAALAPPYDLVSLLIGVNNQYRGRAAAEYRGEFEQLLARAIALAGDRADRVFVLSIPDWGTTPFAISSGRDRAQIARELDAYNAIAREVSKQHGVAFVDITGISRESVAPTEFLADDGLHPSAAQYTRWAEAARPVVATRLGR